MGQLVRKYDTTVLEQKIAQAEALDKNDYTAESWKAANLANTINAAKEVIENRGNKDDVHDAIEKLETAIEKLVPVSNEVTVGRGNFQKKLAPGTYSLPIELLNGGKSRNYQSVYLCKLYEPGFHGRRMLYRKCHSGNP